MHYLMQHFSQLSNNQVTGGTGATSFALEVDAAIEQVRYFFQCNAWIVLANELTVYYYKFVPNGNNA